MPPGCMPMAAACASAATSALACRISCTADSFVCAAEEGIPGDVGTTTGGGAAKPSTIAVPGIRPDFAAWASTRLVRVRVRVSVSVRVTVRVGVRVRVQGQGEG